MRAVQPDIDVAVAAASAGAAVVRAAYGAVHVRHAKSGTDFATEADLEAEAAILGVIRAAWVAAGGGRDTSPTASSPTTCTSPPASRSVGTPVVS